MFKQIDHKIWDDYISFIKKEEKQATINYMCKLEMPLNLNKITYLHFKNIVKSVYAYETTYPETHERRNNDVIACPTCGKECYSKGWLTQHRKNSDDCKNDYYAELENLKICTNLGCGRVFHTHADREKHEQYHCGNEDNAYANNSEEGVIDRRTPYGFGTPKKTKDCLTIWPFSMRRRRNGNASSVITRKTNINGTKSSGTLPPRMGTNPEYQMKDGGYY